MTADDEELEECVELVENVLGEDCGWQQTNPLHDAIDELRATVESECIASVGKLDDRAEAKANRYRDVDQETLRQLAQWVASRVAGGADAS